MPKATVDNAIHALQQAGASMRCADLQGVLESIGFEIKDRKKPGHKVVYHAALSRMSEFSTTSYTCGHGKNPEVRPAYVKKMLGVIRHYESELKELNGETA